MFPLNKRIFGMEEIAVIRFLALTSHKETEFPKKKIYISAVVLVDLSAASDTVWVLCFYTITINNNT